MDWMEHFVHGEGRFSRGDATASAKGSGLAESIRFFAIVFSLFVSRQKERALFCDRFSTSEGASGGSQIHPPGRRVAVSPRRKGRFEEGKGRFRQGERRRIGRDLPN